MKHKIFTAVLLIAIGTTFSILRPSIFYNAQNDASKNQLIASHIYDSISKCVGVPFTITRTMATDRFLYKALKDEEKYDEGEIAELMTEYLSSIRNKFGYIATFVISDKTKRYYTPRGISKIVDPKEAPYDIWYKLFVDSGKDLALDTDRDQVNDYRWTVFINARITDSDGKLLGVCGIGVFMDELQDLIFRYETEYGLKINLVDHEGLVQVDTDSTNIENAFISEAIGDKAGPDSFVYSEKRIGGFRFTRYMPDLEWYLVIQGYPLQSESIKKEILVALIYFFLFALLLITICKRKKKAPHNFIKNSLPEDFLTGLPNRNYLRDSYGELGIFNTTRYKSLIMFDIDRFKVINDTRGEGDAIILAVVERAKKTIGDEGILFRWSGDEFVAFFEADVQEAEKRFNEFCKSVSESLDVTVSVGIVTVDLSESIKTNYHRAVQMCYVVKENGGNGVKVRV
ncbi:sensor domain-containing diguanylate cyclase [uncultured Treponema sp.]|uniref:sensor domain-containing diguanylate cyclase n=1 Tax=uncultured Treponema sp. TaxID=162155 RepID=UPI0025CC58CD|nr:sensor domain-containing diguanylate cyclase [uncultured Treponema sp.]